MLRVGLIQLNTGNEVAPALQVCEAYIRDAAERGATFVTTPETTHMMEMDREAVLAKAAFEHEDQGVVLFKSLAKELSIWLHIGSLIIKISDEKSGQKLANRAFLISPEGQVVARYDKLHLFDVDLPNGERYRESRLYKPGEKAVMAETAIGNFGLSICYDLRFANLYRKLATAGASILLVPAAFTVKTGEAHWHTLLKARAIETGSFILAAAQTGLHDTGRSTYGHSLAIDPWGTVLADAGSPPGVTLVDLDLSKVAKCRTVMPSLQHGLGHISVSNTI
ncbi:MAG: carbon-nitrogen hydrolase family protein [Kordiimonadaceae bacterium]|nr:carbon-nitrogen hydrolase family protein [Kordiimonadaceae bacterium]